MPVGPAIARPSDFIQSKPSSSPGQPTNVDKFPYNPSTTGNKVSDVSLAIKLSCADGLLQSPLEFPEGLEDV